MVVEGTDIFMGNVIGKTIEQRGKFREMIEEELCKLKSWIMVILVYFWVSFFVTRTL